MSLVANPLQEFQCRGVAVNEERIRVAHPDDLLKALGQTDHCKFLSKTKFSQRLESKVELTLASVNDNELRQIIRSLGQHPGISPVHHFLHRGIVIGPDHGLDLEFPVIFLGRHPAAEDNAGGYRIGTLDIGVVEALYVLRQDIHPDGLAEFLQHGRTVLVRVGVLFLADGIELILPGVPCAQVQQGELVTLDRDAETDSLHLHVRKERHNDLAGNLPELGLYFSNELAQD